MSIRLNATTEFLRRTTSLPNPGSAFSFCCWVRLDAVSGYQAVISWDRGSDGDDEATFIFNGGDIEWYDWDSGEIALLNSNAAADTWVWVGFTVTGTTFKTFFASYADASIQHTTGTRSGTLTGHTRMIVGTDGYGEILNGDVAYLRMWTASLSEAELDAERWAASAVTTANLHLDTPLPSTADVADDSGNGRDWTVQGSPTDHDDPDLGEEEEGTTGTVAISARCSVAAAGTPVQAGTSAITARASVASAGTPVAIGTVALAPTASVAGTGTGLVAATGTAAFTATASVAAAGTPVATGAVALSAQASVASAGQGVQTGTGAFTATVSVAGSGSPVATGTAALAPTVGVAAEGEATDGTTGTAALATSVSVAAAGNVTHTGTASLAPRVTVSAAGKATNTGTAAITVRATVAATGTPVFPDVIAGWLSASPSRTSASFAESSTEAAFTTYGRTRAEIA